MERVPVLLRGAAQGIQHPVLGLGARGSLFGDEMDSIRRFGGEPARVFDMVWLHGQDEIGRPEQGGRQRSGTMAFEIHLGVRADLDRERGRWKSVPRSRA